MGKALIQVLSRFRPREGWISFLLILVALLCPPAALIQTVRELGSGTHLILTALAVILGLRLARSRLSALGATVLGTLLGCVLVTVVIGRLVPPPSLLWDDITYTVDWMGLWRQGEVGQPWPFPTVTDFLWRRINDLGMRLWWWGQTVTSGGPARDPIILALLAASLTWGFGLFATWQVYRRRSALFGLLPSGTAVATISFFGGVLSSLYLIAHLFCTLWLIAACHLRTCWDQWESTGTDYPGDLGTELVLTLTPVLTLILVLAGLFPVIGPRQTRDAFWKVMDGPWSAVEQVSERLFGPIEASGASGGRVGGSLPRVHLLGAGADLDETIVLYVATNDPPPTLPDPAEQEAVEYRLPTRYWRSVTYDTYTGQGWINSTLEARTSAADQVLDPNLPPGFELYQQFDLITSDKDQMYAVNAPLRTDHTVRGWWRAPGDLAKVTSKIDHYSVISRPPDPTIAELRNASTFVAPDMAERYVSLPETIPHRVLDLAEQVVASAETRYDQARAIETYLRAYSYTLDLPDPRRDQDVVDAFLFELQEGYCDYYASAMVVMARAVGIPARLASGYAQGSYDYDEGRWVVAEKDGHSWVEVYFDGIGWVEFEPTAGLPALDRLGGEEILRPVVPPLPPRVIRWWRRIPWELVLAGGVMLLLAGLVVCTWRPRPQPVRGATDLVLDRYTRLLQWGARLEQPLQDGETPLEYGITLSNALHARGQHARWSMIRGAGAEAPPDVRQLTEVLTRAQYGPEALSDREGWRIRDLWVRLRRWLWWLWLGRR